jgi:hypothetical protein
VADQAGISWRQIWDDAANDSVRSERKEPDFLQPGDKLHIPKFKARTETVTSGKTLTFRKLAPSPAVTTWTEDSFVYAPDHGNEDDVPLISPAAHAPVVETKLIWPLLEDGCLLPGCHFLIVHAKSRPGRKPILKIEFDFMDEAENVHELAPSREVFQVEMILSPDGIEDLYTARLLLVSGRDEKFEELVDHDGLKGSTVFDVSDDSTLGFPSCIRLWSSDIKPPVPLLLPLTETLPEMSVENREDGDEE